MRFLGILVFFGGLIVQASTLDEFNLSEMPWIDPFTRSFLQELQPQDRTTHHQLDSAIDHLRQSHLTLQNQSFHLKIAERKKGNDRAFIITIHSGTNTDPLGVLILSVQESPSLNVTYEFLKVSPRLLSIYSGIGHSAFALLESFTNSIHATSDRVEAGWLGRYLWAKKNFAFRTDITVSENGQAMSQLELAKRNFLRFCKKHGLKLQDLRRSKNFLHEPISESLSELQTPFDFMSVVHKNRRKIPITPYTDYETLGPLKHLDIGSAFMVSDYRPSKEQANSILVGGLQRSDVAMPPWFGFRNYSCENTLTSNANLKNSNLKNSPTVKGSLKAKNHPT